jgi:hypothetical protein
MTDAPLRVLELGNSNRGFADRREIFTGDADLAEADLVVMHFAELGNLFAQLVGQDRERAWQQVQAGMKRLDGYLERGGTLVAVPVATSSAYYGSQPYVKELIGWAQRLIGAEPKHKTGQQVRPAAEPAYRDFFEKLGADLYHTMYLDKPQGPVGLTVAEGSECVASHRWVGDSGLVLALPEVKNPEKRRTYVMAAASLGKALRAAAGKPQPARAPGTGDKPQAAAAPPPQAAGAETARPARSGAAIGPLERLLSSVRAASRTSHDNDDEAAAAPAAGADTAPSAANDDRRPAMTTVERGAAARPRAESGGAGAPAPAPAQPRRAAEASWSDRFLLPEEAETAQQIMAIEEKIAALQEEEKRLRQALVSGKHRKSLFDGQGDAYTGAVREAFEGIGYRIEKAGNGETSFLMTHASAPDATAVVYCSAAAGAAAAREIVARLLHLEASYYARNGRLPKAVAVVNAHAATPLDERDMTPAAQFGEELVDISTRRGWCVLSGVQLLALARDGEKSAERRGVLAQQLNQAQGQLDGYRDWHEYLTKTGA